MGQNDVYYYLKKRKTPATALEMEKALGIGRSSLVKSLSRLIKAGDATVKMKHVGCMRQFYYSVR